MNSFRLPSSLEIYAHRGGPLDRDAAVDENSWEAIEHTASLGGVSLETDARLTKDGQVVLLHDDYVERVWDGRGKIDELTWDEFSSMRSLRHGCRPTRLVEVLDAFPDLRINIDAKDNRVLQPLCETICAHGARERVRVASFSYNRLRHVRNVFKVKTSLSPAEVLLLKILTNPYNRMVRYFSRLQDVDAVQVPAYFKGRTLVTKRFVEVANDIGLKVHVWTVNDQREMCRLAELGIQGIMTDRPDYARSMIRA